MLLTVVLAASALTLHTHGIERRGAIRGALLASSTVLVRPAFADDMNQAVTFDSDLHNDNKLGDPQCYTVRSA